VDDSFPAAGPADGEQVRIRDLGARLALSPVLGALVPNLSGFIDNRAHSPLSLVFSYAYFGLTALLIWEGNRRLYFRFPGRGEWFVRPWRRVALLLGSIVICTIPVLALSLSAWWRLTRDPSASWGALLVAILLCVTIVVIVTHAYETVFLLGDWQREWIGRERAQRARLEADLDALRYQVEPHFLFNGLNALAHLVESGSPRATEFLEALTESYRYLLDTRGRPLVPLAEDLAAMHRFQQLSAIRFGSALEVRVDVTAAEAERWLCPPVTLQELLENATKHNLVDADAPLVFRVALAGDTLVASNTVRPRAQALRSTGMGLANLSGRVRLITRRDVTWERADGEFRVRVPLVKGGEAAEIVSDRGRG
jgi:hypothetical protein